ncbi:MAG: hypothetical protein PUC36_04055 [Clostridiales bacterium]|nr:hypothetical protein [Clostridiales bacterium]
MSEQHEKNGKKPRMKESTQKTIELVLMAVAVICAAIAILMKPKTKIFLAVALVCVCVDLFVFQLYMGGWKKRRQDEKERGL